MSDLICDVAHIFSICPNMSELSGCAGGWFCYTCPVRPARACWLAGSSQRVGSIPAHASALAIISRTIGLERVIMSNSILVSPRNVRVTRQTRYALAGSGVRHRPQPVTITHPDGRVEVITQLAPARKRKARHKPARRVARVVPVEVKTSTGSLFDSEFREKLASLGGYAPESYL